MGHDMFLMKRNKGEKEKCYEVCYWKKVNQIREWFINHIEEFDRNESCKEFILSEALLKDLVQDCKEVLIHREKAKILLPVLENDTEYDEGYYCDLIATIIDVETILKETDFEAEEIFYYEWW